MAGSPARTTSPGLPARGADLSPKEALHVCWTCCDVRWTCCDDAGSRARARRAAPGPGNPLLLQVLSDPRRRSLADGMRATDDVGGQENTRPGCSPTGEPIRALLVPTLWPGRGDAAGPYPGFRRPRLPGAPRPARHGRCRGHARRVRLGRAVRRMIPRAPDDLSTNTLVVASCDRQPKAFAPTVASVLPTPRRERPPERFANAADPRFGMHGSPPAVAEAVRQRELGHLWQTTNES